MMEEGHVFACHKDRWDAIWFGELGSSATILGAGYNIGSFLIRCVRGQGRAQPCCLAGPMTEVARHL
jgi:hypothetical protein